MHRALFAGDEHPPELDEYLTAAAFWQRLGVSGDALGEWPEEKVRRFIIVMEAVVAYEAFEREKATRQQARTPTRGR